MNIQPTLTEVCERLDELRAIITAHLPGILQSWYGTAETAKQLGKSEYTVREWCRLGRINAQKRISGRGKHASWVISHDELQRICREGLLSVVESSPPPKSEAVT
jgi:Helix-turn-helix domain